MKLGHGLMGVRCVPNILADSDFGDDSGNKTVLSAKAPCHFTLALDLESRFGSHGVLINKKKKKKRLCE